jgi:hypothetical protein
MKSKYEFKITLTLGLVLVIIGIIVTVIFLLYPEKRSEVIFISTVLGALCGIYSTFYVGFGLKQQQNMTKLDNSFTFLDKYDDLDFNSLSPYLNPEFDPSEYKPTEFYEKSKENEELYSALRMRYNFFEDLSLAIQNEYVIELLLYDSLDNILQLHCSKFDIWIQGHRELFPNPSELYIEVKKLRIAWDQRILLSNGHKISELR